MNEICSVAASDLLSLYDIDPDQADWLSVASPEQAQRMVDATTDEIHHMRELRRAGLFVLRQLAIRALDK